MFIAFGCFCRRPNTKASNKKSFAFPTVFGLLGHSGRRAGITEGDSSLLDRPSHSSSKRTLSPDWAATGQIPCSQRLVREKMASSADGGKGAFLWNLSQGRPPGRTSANAPSISSAKFHWNFLTVGGPLSDLSDKGTPSGRKMAFGVTEGQFGVLNMMLNKGC